MDLLCYELLDGNDDSWYDINEILNEIELFDKVDEFNMEFELFQQNEQNVKNMEECIDDLFNENESLETFLLKLEINNQLTTQYEKLQQRKERKRKYDREYRKKRREREQSDPEYKRIRQKQDNYNRRALLLS